jgi:hypothetical protein
VAGVQLSRLTAAAAVFLGLTACGGAAAQSGGGWQVMSVPSNFAASGLSCPSSGDCWAAGGTGIWHYTGGDWSQVGSPGKGTLDAIACADVDDCWAVGGHFTVPPGLNDGVVQPLIEHGGSARFAMVNGPHVSGDADSLDAVTCLNADDCWAVGTYGANSENGGDGILHPLIEHYDGAAWSVVTAPTASPLNGQLAAVACSGPSECWAVGNMSGSSQIERYNGDTWQPIPTPQLQGGLSGIACTSADDCWAVGSSGAGVGLQPLVVHYTDGGWQVVSSPHVNAANGGSLVGVACASATDCWAVGEVSDIWDLVGTPPPDTPPPLIEHYVGGSWKTVSSSQLSTTGGELGAASCTASGTCYAVGRSGFSSAGLAEMVPGS